MAVTVRDNTKNGDQWNEWATILDAKIYDADAQQNKYDDLVKGIVVEKKSKRWGEKSTVMGGLGDYGIKAEGQDAAEDTYAEGYAKFIAHNTFSKSVVISKEMRDDNMWDEAEQKVVNLVQASKRTRAKFVTAALAASIGSTTTMTFGGQSGLDIACADSLALFNSAHPLKNAGSGVTQGNHFSDVLGSNTTVLNKVANVMRNFKDDRGEVLGFTADTIIVPGNDPEYEDFVKRVIGSDGEVGTNNNDINTQRGRWKLIVNPLWTPTISSTNHPLIIMSSEALKELQGTKLYSRTPLDIENEVKVESRNMVYNGFERYSLAFTNWRHVALIGSSDADAQSL
jgi:phage major head subunit gpT-like protein